MRTLTVLLLGAIAGAWIGNVGQAPAGGLQQPFEVGGVYSPVSGSRDCVVRVEETRGEWLRISVVAGCRDKFTQLHAGASHDAPIWYYPPFGQVVRGPLEQ